MPEKIVVVGDLLWNSQDDDSYWGDRKDEYGLFDRYKEEWVQEVMDDDPDEEFRDDLFTSYDEYMKFWGTEDLDQAQGSVYAKRYKNWTKEDEDFYKKFVEDADEGVRNNIQILKPSWEEVKRVKRRMKYHWAELKD